MSKIVFFNIPAHGHVNPTLPVMRELVKRGHQVIAYNGAEFRDKISATGVDFRAYPEPIPSSREISEAMHSLVHSALVIMRITEEKLPFVIEEMRREQPDVIIYDTTASWGYMAARTLGIPAICSIVHLVLDGSLGQIPRSAFIRHMARAIPHLPGIFRYRSRMARDYGKENVGGITEYADLNLVYTSRAFHPQNSLVDGNPAFHFVGPAIDPAARNSVEFPWEAIQGQQMVLISLGTINNLADDFYQMCFQAFADHPAKFVLSVGKHTDIASLGTVPENFIVRHFVPQLELLQQANAFITHGGINSVQEGLYYGVPLVVVPQQLEQLFNGKTVAQEGAGLLIGGHGAPGKTTSNELRQALNTVLSENTYRQNAARIGDTFRAAGGYPQAVAEIEQFIAGQVIQQSA